MGPETEQDAWEAGETFSRTSGPLRPLEDLTPSQRWTRSQAERGRNFKPSADRPDFPHEYDLIPASTLHIEPDYQRKFQLRHAMKIVQEYDPLILDAVLVNVREDDNEPWLVRGQHRVYALKELFGPEVMVPCRIYYGLTREQEALIFVSEDTSRKMIRPSERWRAALMANWSPYVEIKRLVELAGWTVSPHPGPRGHIRAIGALKASYLGYGEGKYLYDALTVARLAGWRDDPTPLQPELIQGMTRFLSRYRDQLPPPRTVAERFSRLPKLSRGKLLELARKRAEVDHLSVDMAMLTTILTEWNAGLSTNRLREPTPQEQRRWQIQARDYPVTYPWHKGAS
jgi:hypothetical protein